MDEPPRHAKQHKEASYRNLLCKFSVWDDAPETDRGRVDYAIGMSQMPPS